MSAFARVSIQWSSEEASEKQRALFLLSNENHYVDFRTPPELDLDSNDDVEEVIMTGKASPIPNTDKVE